METIVRGAGGDGISREDMVILNADHESPVWAREDGVGEVETPRVVYGWREIHRD
jgi:hypothetical protein